MALPLVSPGVMEDAESGKGYIGCYNGGAFGLPATFENKDASPRITNTATYDDPEVIAMDQELTATTRCSRTTGICLQALRLSAPRSDA